MRKEQKEWETEDPKQAWCFSAEPDVGLRLCEVMTLAKIKSWMLSHPSHPGAPTLVVLRTFYSQKENTSSHVISYKHITEAGMTVFSLLRKKMKTLICGQILAS